MDYADLLFHRSLADTDPFVDELIHRERTRQNSKIILIPSESICYVSVREALGSVLGSIYAEGYYPSLMEGESEEELYDLSYQLVRYRRYADRRFYKGCEFANLVEYLAGRRAAALFATEKNPAENIFVNVQPLSGSTANSAVYDAFVEPGDTVMGLSLMHGGHLTHGSEFNRSGKEFNIVSYEVHRETERLDYDEIARLAREHRPKMIIGGYTSYPWAPDWKRFREICDEVGAVLFADVSHPAGMIAASVYPNPIDYADVTTCTTHKTLFGPRGAIIMTTRKEHAEAITQAVFPGEQGGPHVNKFAAMAVAFKLAAEEPFREVQRAIVHNARYLGEILEKNGLRLAYGGTDTHIVLIDLKSVKTSTGYTLLGETAVRMLDLVGIVANKNTIPGDTVTAEASGIRLGTPWISQRGISREGIKELGGIITRVIHSIRPFSYVGLTGSLPRGKIDVDVLHEARGRTASLIKGLAADPRGRERVVMEEKDNKSLNTVTTHSGTLYWSGDVGAVLIRGPRAYLFLDRIITGSVDGLSEEICYQTLILREDETLRAPVSIVPLSPSAAQGEDSRGCSSITERGPACILFFLQKERVDLIPWLQGLADGYVSFDEDVFKKIDGPVVIEPVKGDGVYAMKGRAGGTSAETSNERDISIQLPDFKPGISVLELYKRNPEYFNMTKPYFVGKNSILKSVVGKRAKEFSFTPDEGALRRSCLYDQHLALGATMVVFAGWEMAVRYGSIIEEHRAVRDRAGLFDISHMGVLEVSGHYATRFLDTLCSNYVPWIECGESQYGYMLDIDGNVIDDIMIYKKDEEQFLIVVNAVNAELDLAWLRAVNEGSILIDRSDPLIRAPGPVSIRNLKEVETVGSNALVDIALQGPRSRHILREITPEKNFDTLDRLQKNRFATMVIAGIDVIVSRTGYTGEEYGYELFLHPDHASTLWNAILERGSVEGVVPVGLGARDSLRIEAGLPLHGHELAGPYNLSPIEAGFGPYVKLHKAFFIGRTALYTRMMESKRILIRFRVNTRGVRIVKLHDHVISRRTGQVIGRVTSSAVGSDGLQVGMAWVDWKIATEGTPIGIIPAQRERPKLEFGKKFPLHVEATILSRFPVKQDMELQPSEEKH